MLDDGTEKAASKIHLAPENIMIEDMETKRIKIIDFGLARKLNPNEVIQDMAGTPEFCVRLAIQLIQCAPVGIEPVISKIC
ncbi:hypothetical protein ACTXT7_008158 [Hymenolepis weldensis]